MFFPVSGARILDSPPYIHKNIGKTVPIINIYYFTIYISLIIRKLMNNSNFDELF